MNFQFLKMTAVSLLVGIMAVACGDKNEGPLLKGHIEGVGEGAELLFSYSFDGDVQSNKYDEIKLDSLGNFEFDVQLPEGVDFMDLNLVINGRMYGAYVENGATSEMNIVVPAQSEEYATVTFTGDNADVNEAVNAAAQAYDFMRYFSMEPAEAKTYEEYSAMLESENARVVKALEGIKDSDKKDYFTHLYDLKYMGQKMSNLSNKLYEEGAKSSKELLANPEYKAMYDRIDINDPATVKANLTGLWVSINSPYNLDWQSPNVDSLIMNLDFIAENVKEPANRRSAICGAPFFYLEKLKPTKADAAKYMDAYRKVAADYPETIEHYQKVVDGIVELNDGDKMPYYPVLTDAEGKQVKLTDLLGKVTYIDIWATWCGPCCREIPYLEKVVERFKDNDKIQFISISVDEDLDAWHKKLDNDKPQWAQYVLSADEKKAFMSAMGIQGIPRFILLDAEGNFIQNDAVRPSDDNVDDVLHKSL